MILVSLTQRLLLLGHLREVELELGTLEDVAVTAAGLAWAGRDLGVETTSVELGLDLLGEGASGLTLVKLVLEVVGLLLLLSVTLLLGANLNTVELLVPLLERMGINLDDARLDESVGADQLVVSGVVDDVQETTLASDGLGGPGEVSSVETKGTVLGVATTGADGAHTLVSDLGHSRLTTELEFAAHAPFGEFATGLAALVERITRDTHSVKK